MHAPIKNFVSKAIIENGPFNGDIAEIGSRDVNGGIKHLFSDYESYTGIDILDGENVDIVIDAADWKPDKKYCCIVSTETFEHTKNWPQILKVCSDSLTDNGVLIITCATNPRIPHSAHTDKERVMFGEYYGNVSRQDFVAAAVAAGLAPRVKIDSRAGDLYAICWKKG